MWYKSDPTKKDTDGDGIDDEVDLSPLKYEYVPYLDKLCELAKEYKKNSKTNYSENELVLQYIRDLTNSRFKNEYHNNDYTKDIWADVAGEIDAKFVSYVNSESSNMQRVMGNKKDIKDPISGENIDFKHLCATLNVMITHTPNLLKDVAMAEFYIDGAAGWGGDLQSMLANNILNDKKCNNYTDSYNKAKRYIGASDSRFSMDDLYADVDAVNIGGALDLNYENNSLDYVLNNYYDNIKNQSYRMSLYILHTLPYTTPYCDERLETYTFLESQKGQFNYTAYEFVKRELPSCYAIFYPFNKFNVGNIDISKYWPMFRDIDVSDDVSLGVADAYTDFIFSYVNVIKY